MRTLCWLIAGVLVAQAAASADLSSNTPAPAVVSTNAPLTNPATVSPTNATTALQTISPVASQPATNSARRWWMPEKADAIYGPVMGAIIALLSATMVAFLAHRHALKRQIAELEHEAEREDKERQYQLKKETYLPLVESLSEAQAFVAQTPTVEFSQLTTLETPLMKLCRIVARIELIAPREVVQAVSDSYHSLIKCQLVLLDGRLPIRFIEDALSALGKSIEASGADQKNVIEQIKAAATDQNMSRNLMALLFEINKEREAHIKKQFELAQKKSDLEFELVRKSISDMKECRTLGLKALVAVRKEVDLPIDERWLEEYMSRSWTELDDRTNKSRDETQKKIREAVTAFSKGELPK